MPFVLSQCVHLMRTMCHWAEHSAQCRYLNPDSSPPIRTTLAVGRKPQAGAPGCRARSGERRGSLRLGRQTDQAGPVDLQGRRDQRRCRQVQPGHDRAKQAVGLRFAIGVALRSQLLHLLVRLR